MKKIKADEIVFIEQKGHPQGGFWLDGPRIIFEPIDYIFGFMILVIIIGGVYLLLR